MGKAILRAERTEKAKAIRRKYGDTGGHCKFSDKVLRPRTDGISNVISTVIKDNLILETMNASKEQIVDAINNLNEDECIRIRKYTPREAGRLMGVREDKLDIMLNCGVSNSSLYKLFGNSIIVDNLIAIMERMFYPEMATKEKPKPGTQLSLWG